MRQFRDREVEKTYLALVHGEPRFQSDWIETPLGRSKRHPERITVRPEGEGRPARTYYELRQRFAGHAYVECHPKTGRTHQLRVHLASVGHPVIGDALYVPRGRKLAPWPAGAAEPARQMLHAAGLTFRHPVLGEPLAFEAPLPADFAQALEALRLNADA
jgi:23S rRNA pseudouridine1911/1915/1917 synthase